MIFNAVSFVLSLQMYFYLLINYYEHKYDVEQVRIRKKYLEHNLYFKNHLEKGLNFIFCITIYGEVN